MAIKLVDAMSTDRKIFDALYQDYYYDIMVEIGELDSSTERTLIVTDSLDKYWKDPKHFPYFIANDGNVVGFSLIRHFPEDSKWMDFEQFYVNNKDRQKGLGKEAVRLSVQYHPGKWIVRVIPENKPGLAFWTKTISKLTKDNFDCRLEQYHEKPMHFFRFDFSDLTC